MGSRFNNGSSAVVEKPESKEMLGCRIGDFQELRRMAHGGISESCGPDRVAIVEWIDVEDHTSPSWVETDQMRADAVEPFKVIRSVGFVVEQNEERISLTMTWGPEETSGAINIPRGLIKGVQIVQVSEGSLP